ncbi:hypothetical protein EDI_252790 [Entamoeba dispar SAW760]|uniref:Transmembrane protein n=1 Tax=Entamoeba dispar (strain ATCC PRA-260 / SAW760) TaxID=370354 RepID=B0EF84_ENTDS|nr:uncharacterized protein EDI_252790 [Entamoeba dispar SAW760]EDR26814.1 hypothetical protein EDI_252790 [Entamoeba dispar SAW760]|eukprot:EDR26814.1 hypothetical protein EDI_252790 [Entamoeba dispar SAW760]
MSNQYTVLPQVPYYTPVQPEYFTVQQPQFVVVQPPPLVQPIPEQIPKKENNDCQGASILFVLGFFVCLTWPACYCIYKNSSDSLAKVFARISFVFSILYVLFISGFIGVYICTRNAINNKTSLNDLNVYSVFVHLFFIIINNKLIEIS